MNEERKTSIIWYLFPLLLGIFGGIIGYLLLKDRDQKTAKNVLYVGIGTLILGFIILAAIPTPPPADTNIPAATPTATPMPPEGSTSTETRVPLPESFESGTYAILWSDGIEKITLARGGFFTYNWVGTTGKVTSFVSEDCEHTTYNCTIYSKYDDGSTVKMSPDALVKRGYCIGNLQNLECIQLNTNPDKWICKKDGKYFLVKEIEWKLHPKDTVSFTGSYFAEFDYTPSTYNDMSLLDIYVLGPEIGFDGAITIIGEERTYTKSVEGTAPAIIGIEDVVDTISVTFQKKGSGSDELAVVIYSPVYGEVLNYGSTTASYGVVSLVA